MKRSVLMITASVLAFSATAAMAADGQVFLNQYGDGSQATIDQSGNSNRVGSFDSNSGFDQGNGLGSGGNQLLITQTGSNNGVGRSNKGYQSGTGNSANITQNGNNSDVDLQQQGNGNGVDTYGGGVAWTNEPNVTNRIIQDGTSNFSRTQVYQSGNNGVFSVIQGGQSNNTVINQSGGEGQAFVRQAVGNAENDLSTLAAYPLYGNNNSIAISQNTTAGLVNYAVAVQGNGSGNVLTIGQQGDFNAANAWQIGNGNNFYSAQVGSGNLAGVVDFFAGPDQPIKQIGNSNNYVSSQVGNSNRALGVQNGDQNTVLNNQGGSNNRLEGTQNTSFSYVQTYQAGSYNDLTYSQSGGNSNYILNTQAGAGLTGSHNVATITQVGTNLRSTGYQDGGAGNSATVTQSSQDNQSFYTQVGLTNTLTVQQTTQGNYSSVNQAGAGHVASITQH